MDLAEEVSLLYEAYPHEKGIYGYSEKGFPLYYFKVAGADDPVLLVQASIHAREQVSGYVALEYLTDFLLKKDSDPALRRATLYVLPLANPDGVRICRTFPLYKANARGVDLNVNFPARFGTGEKNVYGRGKENATGDRPASEKETVALMKFTEKVFPDMTVSLHVKGEEIYYDFYDEAIKKEHARFARAAAGATGYAVKTGLKSAGGYKDWCVQDFCIPSLTVELGRDALSHPIGKEYLKEIFGKTRGLIPALIGEYGRWKNGL